MKSVKEAKAFLVSNPHNDELLAAYRKIKAMQRGMTLAALTSSCRITDKLFSELRKRGVKV